MEDEPWFRPGGLKRKLDESMFGPKKLFFFQSRFLILVCVMLFFTYCISSWSMEMWGPSLLRYHYQRLFSLPTTGPTTRQTTGPPVTATSTWLHYAHPHNYQFIMDNKDVCKTKAPFLVLMVPVAPGNVEARNAIRQTWGNSSLVQGKVVLTLFMLGHVGSGAEAQQLQEKLHQENLQHHDLIQSDFHDCYKNLTIKTMVIMDWLAGRCPTAAYAMKIDSDMFLNIANLVTMLNRPDIPKQNYLTGLLRWNRPVVRTKGSRWYVSKETYPDNQYPTYALGMGYVFSNDLPGKFVEVSKSMTIINIEDAFLGICMKKLGIELTSPPDPSQFKVYSWKYDRCEYSKIITYILGSSKELVTYWTDLKKPGPPCSDNEKKSLGGLS